VTSTTTLPWAWYVDPAVLELERRRVFRRSWQYVGHVGMLAADGGYFPSEVAGVPIVVTRESDDAIRALVNVCRHRGSVVCHAAGAGRTLRCPYHAWTYGLDGGLRSAPRADREAAFDPAVHGLAELPVGRWGPFLFAAADARVPPFEDWIGVVATRVDEVLDIDSLRFLHRWEGSYRANWKVCVENFLECYHCRVAHPGFSKLIDTGPDDYGLFPEPHGSSQNGPVRQEWTGPLDPTGPVCRGQFHVLHPNTAINIMPGHPNLSIGPVIPVTPDETYRYLDYFVGPDVDEDWVAAMVAFDEQVGAEDRLLVESVQRGMAAGGHDHGTLFLDSEQLIAHFASYLNAQLASPG
jgi:choline monooxygenase